ncbi:MAG: Fis family transcriptional regulator [Halioglobus sp.]|jgi:Fis family transcriptional regulator
MTRAEPLRSPLNDAAGARTVEPESADATLTKVETTLDAIADAPSVPEGSLREAVTTAVRHYLDELDGQLSTDVYQMVLTEIEAPLLEEIMTYTRNNQTKASQMLGLNRGTLRKKLKQYKLISDKG